MFSVVAAYQEMKEAHETIIKNGGGEAIDKNDGGEAIDKNGGGETIHDDEAHNYHQDF